MNSPQGDIKLKKKEGTYNTYTLEVSHGQIQAIMGALSKDHSDPISDELYAIFGYYMAELPGPGESKEDLEAQNPENGTELMGDAQGQAQYPTGALPPGDEDDGMGLPTPPTDAAEPSAEGVPAPEDLPVGGPEDEEPEAEPDKAPAKKSKKPAEDTTETDAALPEPPKE